MKMEKVII